MKNIRVEAIPEAAEQKLALTVKRFCELTGVTRGSFYRYVKKGDINVVKLCGRTLIPHHEVERLLATGRDAA